MMYNRSAKGAPSNKYVQIKRYGLSIALAVFFVIPLFSTAPAAAAASDFFVTRSDRGGSAAVTTELLTVQDWNGTPVPTGCEEDAALSAAGILTELGAGEAGARQSALFATAEDRRQGIVKNTVDIAARPIDDAMDLVIVLDVSSSMAQPLPNAAAEQNTRLAVAKQAIILLSERILSENESNRVSVVAFSKSVDGALGFTDDQSAVTGFVSALSVGSYTNYESGFNQAETFLSARVGAEAERKSYVVFITDGQPNRGDTLAGANRLKHNTNAELYCVGIQSDASDLFRTLVTDDSHFSDCGTAEEFMYAMRRLNMCLPAAQSATLHIELGSRFTLLCNEDYPITLEDKVYYSVDELPTDLLLFAAEGNQMQWGFPTVSGSGVRLSYYTRLTDEARAALKDSMALPVNNAGHLEYHPHYKEEGGAVQIADESIRITLPAYFIRAARSVLTVTLLSDHMKSCDVFTGEPLHYADHIRYTVLVENTGDLAAEQVVIGARIPDGTQYVSGAAPDDERRIVVSCPMLLLPNAVEELSFIVRVDVREGAVSNAAFLSVALPGQTVTEDIETLALIHPIVANHPMPTPPPQPPAVSPTKKPSTGDLMFSLKGLAGAEMGPYSLTIALSDDSITGQYGDVLFTSGKAEFTSTRDIITVKGLPAGVGYRVQISSNLPYTYKIGENSTSVASGTVAADTASEVTFYVSLSGDTAGYAKAPEPELAAIAPPETPPAAIAPPETPPAAIAPPETPPAAIAPPETPPAATAPPETPPAAIAPPETPPADQPALYGCVMPDVMGWLYFVAAALCMILTFQIVGIRSDLRVLQWYTHKKVAYSNQSGTEQPR